MIKVYVWVFGFKGEKMLNVKSMLYCLLLVLFVVTAIGIAYLVPDQSLGITYTEYDIISIDTERFAYIDSNNKIRSVRWCDYQRYVDVYRSDRTYVVIESGSNEYCRKYNLYLNASDLK